VSLAKPTVNEVQIQLLADSRRVAQQARRAVRWRAVLWFLAGVTLTICLLLMGDYVLRREESFLRWLWPGLGILATLFFSRRLLLPAFRFRASPMDVARWLEKRRPNSLRALSVALELAEIPTDDSRYGSPILREAAMAEWISNSSQPEWSKIVQWTDVQRALLGLVCVLLLGLLLFGVWPESSWQALRRLFLPWSADHWPRSDQLELVNLPKIVGYGTSLQLELIDVYPPLPADVTFEVRHLNDQSDIRTYPGQITAETAVTNLPPLQADVEVRATGGDDQSMPWQLVRVIAVPQWKSHRIEVSVPEYIRLSQAVNRLVATESDQGSGLYALTEQRVAVPAGSRVQFFGELDRVVEAVAVASGSASKPAGALHSPASELEWTPALDRNGTGVRLHDKNGQPLRVDESIQWTFSFQLEGDHLLESSAPWRIEAVADHPPERRLVWRCQDLPASLWALHCLSCC